VISKQKDRKRELLPHKPLKIRRNNVHQKLAIEDNPRAMITKTA